jgi:hypothetical protein
MTVNKRLHTPLMLGAFGLVFFAVGLYAVHVSWNTDVDLAGSLRAAPVVDAASIGTRPVGTTVLVEGTVAALNPVLQSGLVTLLHQEAEAVLKPGTNDRRIAWKTLQVQARPLWIDTPTGPVAIVNSDYAWRDPARVVPAHPTWVTPGTLRVAGFGIGDAIVAHAVVVTHAGAAALRAVEIDSGTRAGYLADKQASDWVGYVISGVFALVGLALLVSAGVGLRSGRTRSASR